MIEDDAVKRIHAALGIPDDYAERTGLPLQGTPGDLVDIGEDVFGRSQRLRRDAASAWRAMERRAVEDGVVIQVVSAFRSLEYQVGLIQRKLDAGEKITSVLSVVAAPGFSEHQGGCALDLTAPGCEPVTEAFENTAAFAWLTVNAGAFDFHMSYPRGNSYGVIYEPWHWRFSGGAFGSERRDLV